MLEICFWSRSISYCSPSAPSLSLFSFPFSKWLKKKIPNDRHRIYCMRKVSHFLLNRLGDWVSCSSERPSCFWMNMLSLTPDTSGELHAPEALEQVELSDLGDRMEQMRSCLAKTLHQPPRCLGRMPIQTSWACQCPRASSLSSDDATNLRSPHPSDGRGDTPSSEQSDEEEDGLLRSRAWSLQLAVGLRLQTDQAGSSPQETVGPARALQRRLRLLTCSRHRGKAGTVARYTSLGVNPPAWQLTLPATALPPVFGLLLR